MAIKKKGNTSFLSGTTVERFENIIPDPPQEAAQPQATQQPETLPSQELVNQVAQVLMQQGAIQRITAFGINGGQQKIGRPRQELIKGVREVSINLQLPENLVQALRAKAKAEKKSMKELIGRAVMKVYPECWANS